ncbi:hypothetical protein [Peribacillus sp. SI8-4]|uniref:hypothetical protein n=1 Tax=Peribacillus sp. SI8-4 TaxID=3048009 RepID=UPI0025566485|nr:hypothetical protein [Peribacillus sp. SI8-4]
MGQRGRRNPNAVKQNLRFNFYLDSGIREKNIRIYDALLDNHNRIYKAVYERLVTQTNEIQKELWEEAEEAFRPSFTHEDMDFGDYVDDIENYAHERIQEQFLMHYQFELMSLSNLYQVFEQQIRQWLYTEMTHHLNEYINQVRFDKGEENYGEFYQNFGVITKAFEELQLTFTEWWGEELIVETEIWKAIRECNLLSNTYKHGSGRSATVLHSITPDYFKKTSNTLLMTLYGTTNLHTVLDIEKVSFEKYITAMKGFWEKLKEHQNGSLMLDVDMTPEES